jgi:hypothetical protein
LVWRQETDHPICLSRDLTTKHTIRVNSIITRGNRG